MTRSMTGFASRDGRGGGWVWTWDIRGVNGRGLDIRLRLPDQIDGVEAPLRAAVQERVGRGNVSVALRLTRDDAAAAGMLNPTALAQAIALIKRVEDAAASDDLGISQTNAADILSMRGVLDARGAETEPEALRAALLNDISPLVTDFDEMRQAEGAALATLIAAQIDTIADLVGSARNLAEQRATHMQSSFRAALSKVLDADDRVDETRVAQEMALLAVKSDVTEELDRLDAHIAAARELISGDGPKGRKLDFLMQEFNREANTLCSKAQFADLTRVGLDLKHTIDQMREQVQNVE